ncbi:MAG TPA: anaerobic dehydrogenase [Chromatiales bacterium]|nr:anaerobic dehydrogenase [Chromatiales bacterium]
MQKLNDKWVLLGGEPTFWCPGCRQLHRFHVNKPSPDTGARWTWDGNIDAPTFSPSLLYPGKCHLFIWEGWIRFLGDCQHELADQIVGVPDLPDWVLEGE